MSPKSFCPTILFLLFLPLTPKTAGTQPRFSAIAPPSGNYGWMAINECGDVFESPQRSIPPSFRRASTIPASSQRFVGIGMGDNPVVLMAITETGEVWVAFGPGGPWSLGTAIAGGVCTAPVAVEPAERSGLSFSIAPNPAQNTATVNLSLLEPEPIELGVYDVAGRRLNALLSGEQFAGRRAITWDLTDAGGERLPQGIYFVKLRRGSQIETRTLVLNP